MANSSMRLLNSLTTNYHGGDGEHGQSTLALIVRVNFHKIATIDYENNFTT